MKIHSVKFNFIMNFILTASSILFPLITFPYITRVLLVEGTGKIAFASSAVTYFNMFASLGIPTYGIRACAKVRDDKDKLSKTVQELLIINSVTMLITCLVFAVSVIVVPEFAAEKELFIINGIGMALNVFAMNWLYNALEQYAYITACNMIVKIVSLVLMFLLVKQPSDYILYGAITMFASCAAYIFNFIYARNFVSFKKKYKYEIKKHLKPILVFFAMSVATSVYTNLDVVMLRFMKDNMEVGLYDAAIKVKSILITLITSLGTVLLPRLSYYVQVENKEAFRRMVSKAFNFVFVAATAVMLYFMIYAGESILFLAGEEYLPAQVPMFILMPTVLLIGLSNITGIQVLTPLGEENKVVCSVVAGAVLDFLLNLVLIPKFGASGAAFATLMAELLVLIIQCIFLKERLRGMLKDIQYWKILLGAIASVVVGRMVQVMTGFGTFLTLCVSAILFFGTYGIVLLLLKERFVTEIWKSVFGKIGKVKK